MNVILKIMSVFCNTSTTAQDRSRNNRRYEMQLREFVYENLLDVNFVKLIMPTYVLQLILGTNCLVIRGKIVSIITFYQKLYSILWISAVTGSLYWFEWSYYKSYYKKEKTLFYTFAFGLLVQYVSYLCNIVHARFFKSNRTLGVFLKMQSIDRALKKNNMASLGLSTYENYINLMWICYTIISFGGGFTLYVFLTIENSLFTIPLGCAILSLYLELILTGSCIYYLSLRLKFLNNVMQSNITQRKLLNQGIHKFGDMIRNPTITVGDASASNMIKLKDFTGILTAILKLFHDISKLFTFQLFHVVVTVFIWTFLVIESTVVGLRSKLIPVFTSVILMVWILFYFLQLMAVAFTCDWFAKQVRDTKRLVVHALSVYFEDNDLDIRKSAWELLQLVEFERPIFSVYGIFELNLKLPLKLISVITTNVLVLIQYTSNALNTN